MIIYFACKESEKVFNGTYSKKWNDKIRRKGQMKLDMLDAAMHLDDLKSPPGNRLHQLEGDLQEYHSISINKQWRIIFTWNNGNAESVRIIDYH